MTETGYAGSRSHGHLQDSGGRTEANSNPQHLFRGAASDPSASVLTAAKSGQPLLQMAGRYFPMFRHGGLHVLNTAKTVAGERSTF